MSSQISPLWSVLFMYNKLNKIGLGLSCWWKCRKKIFIYQFKVQLKVVFFLRLLIVTFLLFSVVCVLLSCTDLRLNSVATQTNLKMSKNCSLNSKRCLQLQETGKINLRRQTLLRTNGHLFSWCSVPHRYPCTASPILTHPHPLLKTSSTT